MESERFGDHTGPFSHVGERDVSSRANPWRPMNSSQPNPSEWRSEAKTRSNNTPIVLIVDDDPMSRELLTDALAPLGFHLIAVADGLEGLRVLEELSPSVMLVDIQMPHMDGFEFLTRVRENPKFAAVPMVAVTAYAMVNDGSRILKHGFDQYLSKPVPVKTLRQTVKRLLSESFSGPAN